MENLHALREIPLGHLGPEKSDGGYRAEAGQLRRGGIELPDDYWVPNSGWRDFPSCSIIVSAFYILFLSFPTSVVPISPWITRQPSAISSHKNRNCKKQISRTMGAGKLILLLSAASSTEHRFSLPP